MGTNFYAKHIPTEEEYAVMQAALNTRDLDTLQTLIHTSQEQYHIGKRSCGWAFLFQESESKNRTYWNNDEAMVPWEGNLDSLRKYLNRPDVQIIDEYGEKFTPEQFWDEEVGKSLFVHDDYDSYATYNKKYSNGVSFADDHERVTDGIRWCNVWFS